MNTEIVSAVRERLISEHETLGSWRAVAATYSDSRVFVNVAYIHNLVVRSQIPGNREIRLRLGLQQRSKPKAKGPVDDMAMATRRALEGWRQ